MLEILVVHAHAVDLARESLFLVESLLHVIIILIMSCIIAMILITVAFIIVMILIMIAVVHTLAFAEWWAFLM